jgi:hypothetical protein
MRVSDCEELVGVTYRGRWYGVKGSSSDRALLIIIIQTPESTQRHYP